MSSNRLKGLAKLFRQTVDVTLTEKGYVTGQQIGEMRERIGLARNTNIANLAGKARIFNYFGRTFLVSESLDDEQAAVAIS